MKRFIVVLFLVTSSFYSFSQEEEAVMVEKFMIVSSLEVQKPLFSSVNSVKGNEFTPKDLLKNRYIHHQYTRPEVGDRFDWQNFEAYKWKKIKANKHGVASIKTSKADYQLAYLAFYIQNDDWADVELTFTSCQMIEVFIDGNKIEGKYTFEEDGAAEKLKIKTKLEANNHIVIIKTLLAAEENDNWTISCQLAVSNDQNKVNLNTSLKPDYFMNIHHLLNGVDIQSAKISAAGDYYFISYKMTNTDGKNSQITDVKRLSDHRTVQLFYGSEAHSLRWAPFDNVLSYITKVGGRSWIWEYNLDEGRRFPVATDVENLNNYTWSPNGEFLIFSKSEKAQENTTGIKRFENMADHWSWYRSRSNLFMFDIVSGIQSPLTYGYLSNNLQDISDDGRFVLFSQHIYDESQRPYSKQILIQYDRHVNVVDTIWNRFGSAKVQYSPDAKQLLVLAGPAFFGKIGLNLTKATIPNDYDNQVYIYDIKTTDVNPLSKTFKPSIENANWNRFNPNHIYLKVSEGTYVNEYVYNLGTAYFYKLDLGVDVVNGANSAKQKPLMVYYGSSISTPKKAYVLDVFTNKKQLLDYPEENFFDKVEFGKNEDWNFLNKDSVSIEGRLYYPPNFDKKKKYPLIVYYYGGTSPTERNFRGRYPKNLFAAKGYIVYVLQPSGATGYGQDFSAKHVNNWGQTVAEEILSGSRLLCQTHSFIDSTNVGCIGASYGGFMTMYLTTYTDFFKTAISHAGISSISSYWGEGHWGYLYSQVASANSFPWNNKKMYIEQSPLFRADKVNTSILLLHGNSDTNVPPGESRQFYTALKMLDKDVELIEIDKQNHHITDYKKRILWQKTILAWFDKNLKDQTDWWYYLYPKNNL